MSLCLFAINCIFQLCIYIFNNICIIILCIIFVSRNILSNVILIRNNKYIIIIIIIIIDCYSNAIFKLYAKSDFSVSEWTVVERTGEINKEMYDCCLKPYSTVTFKLTLRRQATVHMKLIVLPTSLLTIMTLVIFCIPAHRPDRIGMSE